MMEIIPSIDLLDGKVVRLLKGNYDAVTVYGDDATGVAHQWRGQVSRLHVVDLEGARSGLAAQTGQIQRVIEAFGEGVQVGGGIRSIDSIRLYIGLGVNRVVLGTAALSNPSLLEQATKEFPGRIILAVDGRQGRVATHGWHEQSELLAVDVVRTRAHLPIAAVLYTDIDRDGTEVGPNVEETVRLGREGGLPVIASGGVGTLTHLIRVAVASQRGNIAGVIIGRALHENRFSLRQAVDAVAKACDPQIGPA
jgi:phosphoribosylformimino-5-aminoimidazole carboxamide ribotide isomerase